jgi:hypothetical protein
MASLPVQLVESTASACAHPPSQATDVAALVKAEWQRTHASKVRDGASGRMYWKDVNGSFTHWLTKEEHSKKELAHWKRTELQAEQKKQRRKAKQQQKANRAARSQRGPTQPPVDTPGRWVPRVDFRGHKSFGWFVCGCGQCWRSAHAVKNKWQQCTRCKRKHWPEFMWVNEHHDRPRDSDENARENNGKPHRQDLCQACIELGVGCWTVKRSHTRQC